MPGAFRRERRTPRFRSRRRFNRWQRIVISILNLTAFLVIWELVARYGSVPTLYLPAVTDVWAETVEMHEEGILFNNLGISLSIYAIGMVIRSRRHPAGSGHRRHPRLDKALSTYVWAIYTMPRIVLMPLLLLWVGINDAARIWIIVLSAVPATLVVIMEGVKTVDNGLLTAGRCSAPDACSCSPRS